MEKSVVASVGRLMIHEGATEDFTIASATITFVNSLVTPGQEKLAQGDVIYVKYMYKA
jgi:hypothetical protein